MQNQSKSGVLSVLISLFLCLAVWTTSTYANEELIIDAAQATYNHETSTTIFEGDVVFSGGDVSLTANRVELVMVKKGKGRATATGEPIIFNVGDPDAEDYATGSSKTVIVDYTQDTLHMIDDVIFKQSDAVVRTEEAVYNWVTKDLKTITPEGDSTDSSKSRTTITIQLDN